MHFPKHDIGLLLYHNDFKTRGLTAAGQLKTWKADGEEIAFKSPAIQQRALDANEIWELHWSARQANRIYIGLAPTLEELLIYCEQAEVDISVQSPAIDIGALLTGLPEHESLELSHNPHKLAEDAVENHFTYDHLLGPLLLRSGDWRTQMIEANDFWDLSWVRPNGQRVRLAAPSLPELLEFSKDIESWNQERRLTSLLKNVTR